MTDFPLNVKEFYKLLKKLDKFTIKFKKKDGSDRIMNATMDFKDIPNKDKPSGDTYDIKKIKDKIYSTGLISVYDLDKKAWRIINYNTTDWIEFTNQDNPKDPRIYRLTSTK